MQFIEEKIKTTLKMFCEKVVIEKRDVGEILTARCGYKVSNEPDESLEFKEFINGSTDYYPMDTHAWFCLNVDIPKVNDNEYWCLSMTTGKEGGWYVSNPQCIVYVNGKTEQAFDTNHTQCKLTDGNKKINIYFYSGMKTYYVPDCFVVPENYCSMPIRFELIKKDKFIEKIYYDILVAFDAVMHLDKKSQEYFSLINVLDYACTLIDFRNNEYFKKSLYSLDKCLQEDFFTDNKLRYQELLFTCSFNSLFSINNQFHIFCQKLF